MSSQAMATKICSDELPHPVSWLVRVSLGDVSYIVGRVVQASVHGMSVRFASLPVGALKVGERYRVENHPGTGHRSTITAEVRHLDGDVVGLWTDAALLACEPCAVR